MKRGVKSERFALLWLIEICNIICNTKGFCTDLPLFFIPFFYQWPWLGSNILLVIRDKVKEEKTIPNL